MSKIPSPFQYAVKLSFQDRELYAALEKHAHPGAVCPLKDEYGIMTFLVGKYIPDARPCCVPNFAMETFRALREHATFADFEADMLNVFLRVPTYGPLTCYDPDLPRDDPKNQATQDACWRHTLDFLRVVWEREEHRAR